MVLALRRSEHTRGGRARPVLRSLSAAFVAVVVGLATPQAVWATSVDDAERRLEQVVDQLEALQEEVDRLAEDYAEAVDRKATLDTEIEQAEGRVAEMAAQLDGLRDDLSAVAVRAYTSAGSDVLGPLFSNASVYNDNLQRDQYSRVALSVGATAADDYGALLTEFEAETRWLERSRAEADALSIDIAEALERAERSSAEYEERRRDAERELGEAIAAEERRRAEESYRRLQAEAAAQLGGGGSSDGSGGGSSDGSGGGSSAGAVATPYPQPSSLAQVAVNAAMAQQGVPYRYASSAPGEAFDCSGLTHYAWAQAGVYLPRNSRAQFASTPRVPISEARPGDLVYFYNPISHVALYIGGGMMVHAPRRGDVVSVKPVNWDRVVGVTRPG